MKKENGLPCIAVLGAGKKPAVEQQLGLLEFLERLVDLEQLVVLEQIREFLREPLQQYMGNHMDNHNSHTKTNLRLV